MKCKHCDVEYPDKYFGSLSPEDLIGMTARYIANKV